MNTKSVSSPVVKVFSAAVLAIALFLTSSLSSFAGSLNDKKPANLTDERVSVKYVGTTESSVVFHVQFENPTAEKFWLIIKNDVGEVVYRKEFTDAHFSKSVFFQKEEVGDITPTFVIRNSKDEVVRQFSVNRTLTENTVVTKL